MIAEDQIPQVQESTVYDAKDQKIGKAGQVYLDDESGRPEWVTVNTGMFGKSESFVPLRDAQFDGADRLTVTFGKDEVKNAPRVDADGRLEPAQEAELYRYYTHETDDHRADKDDLDRNASPGVESPAATPSTGESTPDRSNVQPDSDDSAMTRSEERLDVVTERVATGKARLRKYVTTEQQTVTVPVTKEKVRLEREPITDNTSDKATTGPEISEDEHEITLTEERPVVTKEIVPVERVKLGTDQVADEKTVSEQVRKENIDLEADTETPADH